MARWAVAMDLGTSGLRAQAIDLSSRQVMSTAMTTRHPLPGANSMDHIHLALEWGVEAAQSILIRAVNRVIGALGWPVDEVDRLAVCGNPTQLSLFQGLEIRDLAYAGARKLALLGVKPPEREATVVAARHLPGLNLPASCEVVIPPAVHHQVGADALAMIIQCGMLEKDETSLATDFGTNAEMALYHNGTVFTGSTAAGPALEGQHITCGMLAAPGAIADLEPADRAGRRHRLVVLNSEMLPVHGGLVDLTEKSPIDEMGAPPPIGITGTGAIAIIHQAMDADLIALPRIRTADGMLHLGADLFLTAQDLAEAGKAIGALRAGHVTLCQAAGIAPGDIRTAYMSGASGTYVDALKAQKLGLLPPHAQTIYQVGNTSLAMARDLAADLKQLDKMASLAQALRGTHCLFAASKTFRQVYILEFSYWTEGMPMSQYRRHLGKYHLPDLLSVVGAPTVVRTVKRDIDELGPGGLVIIGDIGHVVSVSVEGCAACMDCVRQCPGKALSLVAEATPPTLALDQSLCDGVSCRRCERVCPEKVFVLDRFFR